MPTRPGRSSCAAVVACAVALLAPRAFAAGRIIDFLRGPTGAFRGRLYGGFVIAPSDSNLILRRGDRVLALRDAQQQAFEPFLRANADEVVEILFPNDLESAAQGIPGGAARAFDAFDRLVDVAPRPPTAAPAGGAPGPAEIILRNDTSALMEFERFRVDGTDGSTFKLTPGYDYRWENFEIGVAMPLRFTNLDDSVETDAYTGGLDAFVKYHLYVNPRWQVIPMIGGGGSVFALNSNREPEFGYWRYGGYAGLASTAKLDYFVIGCGVVYSVSDIEAPSSLVPDDLEPLEDALFDRPVDQQIVAGGKIAVPLGGDFLASLGGRHLETLGASALEHEKRGISQVSASLMYFPAGIGGLEIGYKHLFGAHGLRASAAFLQGVMYF